jgi:hypothetical protein
MDFVVLVSQHTSDQNVEETLNTKKKSIFPTMTKQTNSDENNLIGTRAEETHWYKNSPANMTSVNFAS